MLPVHETEVIPQLDNLRLLWPVLHFGFGRNKITRKLGEEKSNGQSIRNL